MVTIEDLKQLQILRKAIQYQECRMQEMEDSLGLRSPSLSDMPKASGARDKIGDIVPEIVDQYYKIQQERDELRAREQAIETWIGTQPIRISLICRLKFLEGKSWQEVADFLDSGSGKVTADSVRMTLYHHMKQAEGF